LDLLEDKYGPHGVDKEAAICCEWITVAGRKESCKISIYISEETRNRTRENVPVSIQCNSKVEIG